MEICDALKPLVNVLGVGLSATNLPKATEDILAEAASGRKGYVCVTGVHGVTEAQNDEEFGKILNEAFLNVPDGMPMSWVGWAQGYKKMDRVYGPDLMLEVSRQSVGAGLTHFYYGGKSGVADLLAEKMKSRFPGLQIVGTYCPPFRPLEASERQTLVEEIRQLKPDFFWVGLSTPKQERFMARYLPILDTKIMLGVGAAFDFHAGLVPQAPRWMQRAGLEWFFRLCCEPRRLWKRYLINNPLFIWRIARQWRGRKGEGEKREKPEG